jgi:hypothetical protein
VVRPGEFDFLGAVPDGVGDPDVGVAVVGRMAPAQAESVQLHVRAPAAAEQEVLDERGECLSPVLVAVAGLADVEAGRGGDCGVHQAAPQLREQACAHRLPRLEVAQDPEEDVVREVVEAVAATAAAGWSLPRRVLRGHFAERVTCTETAAGGSTQESRTPLARNKERRANRNGLTSNPRTRRGRKGFRDGLASERREERTDRIDGLAKWPVLGFLRRRSVVPCQKQQLWRSGSLFPLGLEGRGKFRRKCEMRWLLGPLSGMDVIYAVSKGGRSCAWAVRGPVP